MGEQENRATVERLVEALNTRDLDLFDAQFHEDSVLDYPQSGERVVGGANRRAVYAAFPTLPHVSPRRLVVDGDLAVLEATLDYGEGRTGGRSSSSSSGTGGSRRRPRTGRSRSRRPSGVRSGSSGSTSDR
jgi:hypothetical protein